MAESARLLWRCAAAAAALAAAAAVRGRLLRWGTAGAEAAAPLPGDALLPTADLQATRAITIAAGAAEVWPWVAQMGQGRGGLYSYDWLENLVGCQIHSADRIVAGWQDMAVGDDFRLHPDVALTVAEVQPSRWLVVAAAADQAPGGAAIPYDFTWAFVLEPRDSGTTRLLVRERYRYRTPAARLLVESVSVASFVMSQKMLRGIRDRAQRGNREDGT